MWRGIFGHDEVVEQFRRTLASGRLASTYLFVGPAGVGKRRFALELARCLLCQQTADAELDACGQCESCRLFAAGNHPDLEVVGLPPDKSELPIALFVGDDQHRNQEGLCSRIALKPFLGGRRVAIIDDADHFNASSANCLLKTLEEPPPHSLLILIGTSPSRQLPTIRSRSQVVRFGPLEKDAVAQILAETGKVADRTEATRLAGFSHGSVERAVEFADPSLWEFREQLLRGLAAAPPDGIRLARSVQAFVDEAGKEAPVRRVRLRTIVGFAVDYYRAQLRREAGGPFEADASLRQALDQAGGSTDPEGAERSIAALEACLATLEHIDRNANLALVVQNWCEQLAGGVAAKS